MDFASVASKIKNVIVPTCTMALFLFSSQAFSQTYQTNGTAVNSGGGLVRLTAAGIGNQTASAWSTTKIDLTQPFDMSFDMFFGCDNGPNGGDGMTFAFHNDPRGLSAVGEGFGYLGYGGAGAVSPSLAFEFDTYDGTASGGGNELAADHVAIDVNGDINQLSGANTFTGTSGSVTKQAITGGRDLESCSANANNLYTIRITWDPVGKVLRLYEEGALTVTYTRDMVATIFGGSTMVYWGFTGATGTASNEQWIAPSGTIIPWQCTTGSCCTAYTVQTTGSATTVCSAAVPLVVSGTTPSSPITNYSWSTGVSGTTLNTINISAPGTYSVAVLQTQGATSCPGRATFNVTSSGPNATISGNASVCDDGVTTAPISVALTGAAPWSLTYKIDGVNQPTITGIATSPYIINGTSVHTYTLASVSNGAGCTGTTSGVASVNTYIGAPVGADQTFNPPAAVPLSVNNGGGTYEWWSAPTGGTLLGTGTTYTTPTISAQTTYYVKNAALTAMTTKSVAFLDNTDYGTGGNNTATDAGLPKAVNYLNFTANSSFTFNSVDLSIRVKTATATNVTLYLDDLTTPALSTTRTVSVSGYTVGTHSVTVLLGGYSVIAGHNYRISYEGTAPFSNENGIMYWDFVGPRGGWLGPPAVITKDPEVTITVPNQGNYPGIFNWQITVGSPAYACGRTAITAIPVPPLPITLLSFTATLQNSETVFVQWSTAMELNNDYFTVQRSADGITFYDISVVDGNGTNNGILHYHDYDYHALSGISYYRLKQTDFDGTISYSSVATISNNGGGVSFIMYPTLTTSGADVNVVVSGVGANEKVSIAIYDMLSRSISNYTLTADASGNIISTITLPSALTQGTYVAEASSQNHTPVRTKLVVVQQGSFEFG